MRMLQSVPCPINPDFVKTDQWSDFTEKLNFEPFRDTLLNIKDWSAGFGIINGLMGKYSRFENHCPTLENHFLSETKTSFTFTIFTIFTLKIKKVCTFIT